MVVTRLGLRDFRCYAAADIALGAGLTVVHGANGAGKTNLLEALFFGCTGHSCRTRNEREVVRFGAAATRVEVEARDGDEEHRLSVGFEPGERKRMQADGAPVERLLDVAARPLVSVFLPDRLELLKGPPALRRGHLDRFVAALRPTRAATRRAYGDALAQRNALLVGVRAGRASAASLPSWDAELARHAIALRDDRAAACELLVAPFAEHGAALGLGEDASLTYRPRSRAADAEAFAAELAERAGADIERGFTGHGPHRDELELRRGRLDLRSYGSQGQQRLGVLALLLAEREVLAAQRSAQPLLLLDDVMSELDDERRERLVAELDAGGQSVITTTELGHVPGAERAGVARLAVADGVVLERAVAA